jgi:hypothetical protein
LSIKFAKYLGGARIESDIVGFFMIGFNDDPNHEYPFEVKQDGTILPMTNYQDGNPAYPQSFYKYLADPTLHHVRFIQVDGGELRDVEHDPWK